MIDSARDESVVRAYHTALTGLLKLVTGLTAAGILLYALGWVRSYGYYDSFNAKWILKDVRIFELASQGFFPFSILFASFVISFMDVAQRFGGKGGPDVSSFVMGHVYDLPNNIPWFHNIRPL